MRRAYRGPILGISAVGLLVLGSATKLGGFFGFLPGAERPYSRAHQQLLASLESTRPAEARLSGDSSYRPYVRPPQVTAKEVEAAIRREDRREPSPESRAALGILALVQGTPDEAVELLRGAQARKPEDPRILNDLAAALLALNRSTGDPWDAVEALEMAERSNRLEPSLPALFNQGIALQRLGLHTRAAVAWQGYLQEDSRSAWAQEAVQRRDRLEREAAKDRAAFKNNPWAARQTGERVLLARWGEKTLAGRGAEAEAALARAEALAASLAPGAGRLLAASAASIRKAQQSGDPSSVELLARGHQAFSQAFARYREERNAAALALLEEAIGDLRAAKSPFELRARVLKAWAVAKPDWAELRDLELSAEAGGFHSITAEVRRIAAYRATVEGRLEAAIDGYRDSRRRFEALGEREAASVVAALTAELFGLLGRERESATELKAALTAAPWDADPWNRYSIYVVAASGASGRFSRAAVELRLEAAGACRDLPERPLCAVDSWMRVAAITPDPEVARDALERAEKLLPAAPDSDGKALTQTGLAMAKARWLTGEGRSRAEWEEAVELLSQVVASYEAKGRAVTAAWARAARARTLLQLGRPEEAAEEYRAGLRLFRRWDERERFRPERAEKRSPRELREVYEALLGLALDTTRGGPSPAAFLLSEEMRDRLAPRRSAQLWLPGTTDLDRFAASVPPGTAVVEYAIAGKRAVAWILAGGRLEQVNLDPQDELGGRIHSLTRERDPGAWKRISGEIFADLLAPVLDRLPVGTERLILVPDSELHDLPFRALWDPASGRYLDERFLLSFAPSVRLLLDHGKDRHAEPAWEGPVLSLGFPSFLPNLGLRPLPQAAVEAEAVRAVYGRTALDDCDVKDWAGFLRCAPRAGVVHLATHASASTTQSERSWLAFERETVTLDRLWRELPDLPRRPLIVLPACQSAAAGGEGLGGLARPFLASGARAVVGTLWQISDTDAAILFPAFHRAYRGSGNAAEALAQARESLDQWEEQPWVWGGIEVVISEIQ